MMLNIKLPKGKVARALVACADVYAASVEAEHTAFHKDLEVWRKDMNSTQWSRTRPAPYPPSPPGTINKDKAMKFMDMALTCTYSTGDVYVSAELWAEIKGYYNA